MKYFKGLIYMDITAKKFEDEYQKKRKDYLGDKYDLDEVYKIRMR